MRAEDQPKWCVDCGAENRMNVWVCAKCGGYGFAGTRPERFASHSLMTTPVVAHDEAKSEAQEPTVKQSLTIDDYTRGVADGMAKCAAGPFNTPAMNELLYKNPYVLNAYRMNRAGRSMQDALEFCIVALCKDRDRLIAEVTRYAVIGG